MWDKSFDESIFSTSPYVIVHCPDADSVDELMEILERCGVKWCTGDLPLSGHQWNAYKENTVYYIDHKSMTYGDKRRVHERKYDLCTFFGCGEELEAATDDELAAFLGIGGV